MTVQQDPILKSLAQIEAKIDQSLLNQEELRQEIDQIHQDCKKTARANGAVAGAISGSAAGGLVSLGFALIKAKFGL